MYKKSYIGENNEAKQIQKIYVGDENGKSRRVVKGYIGVNGEAKLIYDIMCKIDVELDMRGYASVGYGLHWLPFEEYVQYYMDEYKLLFEAPWQSFASGENYIPEGSIIKYVAHGASNYQQVVTSVESPQGNTGEAGKAIYGPVLGDMQVKVEMDNYLICINAKYV